MYIDASRNPITALDLVDTLVEAFHCGFATSSPELPQSMGVPTSTYNELVHCYNTLLHQSHESIMELQLQLHAARAENLRLHAQLMRYPNR